MRLHALWWGEFPMIRPLSLKAPKDPWAMPQYTRFRSANPEMESGFQVADEFNIPVKQF